MGKNDNLRDYLVDLHQGILTKKPDASRNPQNFRSEIEAIRTGGEFYEVMDASELPLDAPDGSLAIVEVEVGDDTPEEDTPVANDTLKQLIEGTVEEIADDTVTKVGDYTFYKNTVIKSVDFPNATSIGSDAFYTCTNLALTSLPSGLTSIGRSAFYSCNNLALTSLPSGLTSIGTNAFTNDSGLTTITFEGTPNSIASNSFSGCTNLITINVPWAEGAVANAPWGATNATINYNYTGG